MLKFLVYFFLHAHAFRIKKNGTIDLNSVSCRSFSTTFNKTLTGICVCNNVFCDTISNAYEELPIDQAILYETTKGNSTHFRRLRPRILSVRETYSPVNLEIDLSQTYQSIVGFGGAFTDATALNIYQMVPATQEQIIEAYFGKNGLQYSLGRIPIASSDFSERVYSYNPSRDDFLMTNFSVQVDKSPNSNKINLIKRALKKSSRDISLFGSSWAPPVWMTKERKVENCHIKGRPGGKYWSAYALYISNFIRDYNREGIKIWGITTQNEPVMQPLQMKSWQSLRFDSETEREWVIHDLGPLLKKEHPLVKIIIMDDQKKSISKWTKGLSDPTFLKYVSGIGVHWYTNLDFYFFQRGDFDKLSQFKNQYPNLFILATEACEGYLPSLIGTGSGVKLSEYDITWRRAENYARDIIGDLSNSASGWTDWNLVLNREGGPNWARNFVDAPIIVDEVGKKEFYKQPMFYIMGHFSKFIPQNSIRLKLKKYILRKSVEAVGFLTPDKHVVLIIQNRSQHDERIELKVRMKYIAFVSVRMSVQTLILNI